MNTRNNNLKIKGLFTEVLLPLIFLIIFSGNLFSTIKNVTVQDFVFTSSNIVAEVGDTVKWTWIGPRLHTTTCDGVFPGTSLPAGADPWDIPLNSGNPAFTYVLAVAGEYNYLCTIHPTVMNGLITANAPLPVELTEFVATTIKNEVILDWATSGEVNNDRFEIQRIETNKLKSKNDDDPYFTVGILRGYGTSTSGHHYRYIDRNLKTGTYSYRLKQVDFNSNFIYHTLNEDIVIGIPSKFDISQNYPNPFNPTTKIDYELPFEGLVKISLFNINGKEVSKLINEYQRAGYQSIVVNGSNLSSGAYFYRIDYSSNQKSSVTITKKMLLVK